MNASWFRCKITPKILIITLHFFLLLFNETFFISIFVKVTSSKNIEPIHLSKNVKFFVVSMIMRKLTFIEECLNRMINRRTLFWFCRLFIAQHYIKNNKVSVLTAIFKTAHLQWYCILTMIRYTFTTILYNSTEEYSLPLSLLFISAYEHSTGSTLIDKLTALLFA